MKVRKIISGGQTGADRAALDFARERGMATGGFVPRGRRAEDGPLPTERYPQLVETRSRRYAERTELNVLGADATIIVSHGRLGGGSRLTRKLAEKHRKPVLHVDLLETDPERAALRARRFLAGANCKTLNIAGPRASEDPEIYRQTKEFLNRLFE